MKVKFLTTRAGPNGINHIGSTAELSKEEAQELYKCGSVQIVIEHSESEAEVETGERSSDKLKGTKRDKAKAALKDENDNGK